MEKRQKVSKYHENDCRNCICQQSVFQIELRYLLKCQLLTEVSLQGSPTFVSEAYTGRCSDKKITNDCGILNLLESGDSVITDRGFDIEDGLPPGVKLHIPPFLRGNSQLELSHELKTRRISSVGLHVERAIARIKNCRILQSTFKLTVWHLH